MTTTDDADERQVVIPITGAKYHDPECGVGVSRLQHYASTVPLSEARERDVEPAECCLKELAEQLAAEHPTLEDALDGLQTAQTYAENNDMQRLSVDIGSLYQRLGMAAPDSDWSAPPEGILHSFTDSDGGGDDA